MKRQLTNPNKDTTIVNTLQVYEGGTGATTVAQAQINLDILPASRLGQPGGPAMLPLSGSLSGGMFEGGVDLSATLSGPVTVEVSTTNTYLITNYDVKTTYVVTATGGSVTVAGDTITYIANSVVEVGTITINGKVFEVPKIDQVPDAPVVTSPVNNAVGLGSSVVYTASAFSTLKVGDTHANSDWEVASDSGFVTIVASSYADATNKTSWTASGLSVSTTYHMRVRYRSSTGKVSPWSSVVSVTTKSSFVASDEKQKLVANDGATNDNFGYSVSLSSDGNIALVGAYNKSSTGAAYIFTRSGSTWTQQQKLIASDGGGSDFFGWSVSISSDGNTALVGASYADPSGITNAGAAYTFTRSGSTWTQQQKLIASEGGGGSDFFGSSVSISSDGNTALVGAYGNSSYRGAAYVFTRSGSTWTQQHKLIASDGAAEDYFGWSVSLSSDGNTALVGAYRKSSNAGAAYIFTRTGSTWTQQQKLVASDAASGDQFGYSVSLSSDGNTALVGAYGKSSNTGAAYIFTRSGSSWTQQHKLLASDAAGGDYFGHSVSLSSDGNTALIGAHRKSTYTGAAYIYG